MLELSEIVETRITDEEVQALHRVIADLGFLHSPNRTGAGCDELLLRARQIVGVTSG